MVNKRKRKFFLGSILTLSIKYSRVNADLFAEGFTLDLYPSKLAVSRRIPKCGRRYNFLSRFATSKGSDLPDTFNNGSHYDECLNSNFPNKKLQKKFKNHAKDFGIKGKYNLVNRDLFRKAIIKHMHENIMCIGTYRGTQAVYHYYNPETHINVMIDIKTNEFISGWRLSKEQIENMERNGNIQ